MSRNCTRTIACGLCWSLSLATAVAADVHIRIVDSQSGTPLPARVYLQRTTDDSWHFVRPAVEEGTAVRYEKQNWINRRSIENHTTVSAHPVVADLAPGEYVLTVERGKEYLPAVDRLQVDETSRSVTIQLRRWIDMSARGWYSGETHLHRTIDELRNVVLAEDLNVAFPLSYWVTKSHTAPSAGNKNVAGEIPDELIVVDDSHVIWPRNTEYEIFTVGNQRHTLGALFVLNHRSTLGLGVPPWGPVIDAARGEGALFDLDKLDWPFSMTLPPKVGGGLYELANNHNWRTEFAFRRWNSPTPPYLQPPFGGTEGGERAWLHYTLGMYYTLLNCGMPLSPTAGTASGVHPVPAGFSRVYVPLEGGFDYTAWLEGLQAGRSMVTTGPMLFAKVNDLHPGARFEHDSGPVTLSLAAEVYSEQPASFAEIIVNGQPVRTLRTQNERTPEDAYRSHWQTDVTVSESSWLCVRVWEDRPGGRFRFAHSAPWFVDIGGLPVRPRQEERDYLVRRVQDEVRRSRDILTPEALAEYDRVLAQYEALQVRDDTADVRAERRSPPGDEELRRWLDNMIRWHRFTDHEVRLATGLSLADISEATKRFGLLDAEKPVGTSAVTILPYPGGRHPRLGFLEGAVRPQRETKFSVFTPWPDAGYVVVDLPEAIFTNLGLTYLAHTHVPTIWSEAGVELQPTEWTQRADGTLELERLLPNGIRFGSRATPRGDHVEMELWLHNGTSQPLTQMRAQVCAMLKGAIGFSAQTNQNKRFQGSYVAVGSDEGNRWIITAWDPLNRGWANPPVPCLHSDPRLPDCPAGETVRARGRLWFYEGTDIEQEFQRLDASGWREEASQ